jgi:hypothetical protein
MVCKTNPSPDSHNSTPSHQLRIPFTGLTLFRAAKRSQHAKIGACPQYPMSAPASLPAVGRPG